MELVDIKALKAFGEFSPWVCKSPYLDHFLIYGIRDGVSPFSPWVEVLRGVSDNLQYRKSSFTLFNKGINMITVEQVFDEVVKMSKASNQKAFEKQSNLNEWFIESGKTEAFNLVLKLIIDMKANENNH